MCRIYLCSGSQSVVCTHSISTTWKLVRNTNSWVSPAESETGNDAQLSVVYLWSSGDSDLHYSLRTKSIPSFPKIWNTNETGDNSKNYLLSLKTKWITIKKVISFSNLSCLLIASQSKSLVLIRISFSNKENRLHSGSKAWQVTESNLTLITWFSFPPIYF